MTAGLFLTSICRSALVLAGPTAHTVSMTNALDNFRLSPSAQCSAADAAAWRDRLHAANAAYRPTFTVSGETSAPESYDRQAAQAFWAL